LLAWAGAVTGDGASFLLGRHYQQQVPHMWPFRRYPSWLNYSEIYFRKAGALSVIVGRFFGPLRAFIPLVAGMFKMPPAKFFPVMMLAALGWAPLYIMPGYFFALSLSAPGTLLHSIAMTTAVALALAWLLSVSLAKLGQLTQPGYYIHNLCQKISQCFSLGQQLAHYFQDRGVPPASRQLGLGLLFLSTSLAFILVALFVKYSQLFSGLNLSVLDYLQSVRTHHADQFMVVISLLASGPSAAVISLVVLVGLLLKRHWIAAGHWLVAVGLAGIAKEVIKPVMAIVRPQVVSLPPDSFSFPSGHTLGAVVIYGLLASFIARELKPKYSWLIYFIASILFILVGLSRLYLGVHWFTDILGSLFLGGVIVGSVRLFYARFVGSHIHWPVVLISLCLGLLISSGYVAYKFNNSLLANQPIASQSISTQ
jgi:undecaprenyl-diphosphatase